MFAFHFYRFRNILKGLTSSNTNMEVVLVDAWQGSMKIKGKCPRNEKNSLSTKQAEFHHVDETATIKC